MSLASKGFILVMSALYFLLALQAEAVTATFGYIFSVLLLIAFIASFKRE